MEMLERKILIIKEYLNTAERPRGMRIENTFWNSQLGADC